MRAIQREACDSQIDSAPLPNPAGAIQVDPQVGTISAVSLKRPRWPVTMQPTAVQSLVRLKKTQTVYASYLQGVREQLCRLQRDLWFTVRGWHHSLQRGGIYYVRSPMVRPVSSGLVRLAS